VKPEEALFFESAADFRQWLEDNHASRQELWVGYHRKKSGRTGMTYPEAVDEALAYGWIDGQLRSLNETSYAHRYTPRLPGSNWSLANVRRIGELMAEGRMHPAGVRAFEERPPADTGVYSYENRPADLPDELASVFRQNPAAWRFFLDQTASYRRSMTWWVVSAKQESTRLRRLVALIDESAAGHRIDDLHLPRVGRVTALEER
jgi:uncharacterized protein YdeI (YjbR/CyaY-like superfamily)